MNLREKILRGGAYLVARQGLGMIIGFVGVVLLTRTIGPGNYGLYTSAFGIVNYLSYLTGLGVNVYIVRREAEPDIRVFHQAFTLMFITGLIGLLLGFAAIPLFQRWFENPAFIPPLLTMLVTLPLTTMAGPVMARLERDLNFRAVAIIELAGQIIYYIVTLTLAYQGKGVWAPVAGYVAWQIFQLIGACTTAHYFPRPLWSKFLLKDMVGYSACYSASLWIWQLRALVNPLIVGRFVGPEGVGYTALAIRMVEVLSFIKKATWRLSIAALAKLQEDYSKLKRAMDEAMLLQVLAIGPFLTGFALLGPWILPLLFGDRWDYVLIVYPFIALGNLFNSVFSMHSSVLYVLKRNWDVTLFHLTHIFLFSVSAYLLVPIYGIWGYAWAEIVALLSYITIHVKIVKLLRPSYLEALPWLLVFIPPLFTSFIPGFWSILFWSPLVGLLLLPGPRGRVVEYMRNVLLRGRMR